MLTIRASPCASRSSLLIANGESSRYPAIPQIRSARPTMSTTSVDAATFKEFISMANPIDFPSSDSGSIPSNRWAARWHMASS